MKVKFKDFSFRTLKITDYNEFKNLFYSCFKKKVSYDFFKWRYFSNKSSFCYGVFDSSKLIANVGMISIKPSNKSNSMIYYRHSSMVLKNYRGLGIFSELLGKVRKKISKKTSLVIMWPNKNNYASFGINKKNTINRKYYLYKTCLSSKLLGNTKNYSIDKFIQYKKFIQKNNSLYLKNFIYFKKRYLSYQRHEYFLNKFVYKDLSSFFILKRNKDKSEVNYVILDHFGSKEIYSKHFSNLITNFNKLIFLSQKKRNNSRYEIINHINLKIGFIKKINIKEKKNFLENKEIFLGDTDIFITI